MDVSESKLKELNLYEKFQESKIPIDTLQKIMSDYSSNLPTYERQASELASFISTFSYVHLTHWRVKKEESLLEKIIRKTIDERANNVRGRSITPSNYKIQITDLIGIRVLHVFKSDYLAVHNQIYDIFEPQLRETVHVNLRVGDSEDMYKEIKNKVKFNYNQEYRSIHYLIGRNGDYGAREEIQVRTIYEEAWSEMNHRLVYKAELSETAGLVKSASQNLSALTGSCDTLGELMTNISEHGRSIIKEIVPSFTSMNNDEKNLLDTNKIEIIDIVEDLLK